MGADDRDAEPQHLPGTGGRPAGTAGAGPAGTAAAAGDRRAPAQAGRAARGHHRRACRYKRRRAGRDRVRAAVRDGMTGARFAAVDVHYPVSGGAGAGCVVASDTRYRDLVAEHVAALASAAPYRPGEFFARELPALRAVLALAGPVDLIVVDGYVDLDPAGRPGLGAHVYQEFTVPVIGVAKTTFRSATHAVPVCRGQATRPLFVTAAGITRAEAAELVKHMAGRYRLPDALRRVDALARGDRSRVSSLQS